MKELSRLIENYRLQIGIFLIFLFLSFQIPFLYQTFSPNPQLKALVVRCSFLNFLSLLLFLFLKGGKYRELSVFPLIGLISGLLYLTSGSSFLMPVCTSSTATSVIEVALIAFVTIRVNF